MLKRMFSNKQLKCIYFGEIKDTPESFFDDWFIFRFLKNRTNHAYLIMKNKITTFVKIVNLTSETHKRFIELFSHDDVLKNLVSVYGEEMYEIDHEWLQIYAGTKRLEFEWNSSSSNCEFSSEMELILNSTRTVPTEYLQELIRVFNEIDKNVVLFGTYEDEGYSLIGAFVFGYNYDAIEDYDVKVDEFEMVNNSEYRENLFKGLYAHRDFIYQTYLDVKSK